MSTDYQPRTAKPQPLWKTYFQIEAADTAAIFVNAAALIEHNGHNGYGADDPGPGISVQEALESSARTHVTAQYLGNVPPVSAVAELVDELLTRLAGVLLMTGQITGIRDNTLDRVHGWENDAVIWGLHPEYRNGADVPRMLRAAANMAIVVAGNDALI